MTRTIRTIAIKHSAQITRYKHPRFVAGLLRIGKDVYVTPMPTWRAYAVGAHHVYGIFAGRITCIDDMR